MRCPECNGEGWTTSLGNCWQKCRTCKGKRELDVILEEPSQLPPKDEIVEARPKRETPLVVRDASDYDRVVYDYAIRRVKKPEQEREVGTRELVTELLQRVDRLENEIIGLRAGGGVARSEFAGNIPIPEQNHPYVLSESIVVKPGAMSSLHLTPNMYSEEHELLSVIVTATSDMDGRDMATQGFVEKIEIMGWSIIYQMPCSAFRGEPMQPQIGPGRSLPNVNYQTGIGVWLKNLDKLHPIRFDATAWLRRIHRIEQPTSGDIARLRGDCNNGR